MDVFAKNLNELGVTDFMEVYQVEKAKSISVMSYLHVTCKPKVHCRYYERMEEE